MMDVSGGAGEGGVTVADGGGRSWEGREGGKGGSEMWIIKSVLGFCQLATVAN